MPRAVTIDPSRDLLTEPTPAQAAALLLPPLVWPKILTLLLRLFPGRSPYAFMVLRLR